jgi:hypothetical protein
MENTAQMIQDLQALCARQAEQIAELSARVSWYEEQHRLSQKQKYGRKSEAGEGQLSIFNEPEKEADLKAEEPTIAVATHQSPSPGLLDTEIRDYNNLMEVFGGWQGSGESTARNLNVTLYH